MRTTLVALALSTIPILGGLASPALADNSKVARGTIASIGGSSLVVHVGAQDMRFAVDSNTVVQARGGSTKATRAAASGRPGPHLDELLTTGQRVAVTYNSRAGTSHATMIRAIPKIPASTTDVSLKSDGVVKAIGPDWITINGRAGGAATFEQTFKIDKRTKVFAKGVGTAVAAKGGRAPFADLVVSGDHVTVSYRQQGDALLASGVHVTTKATH